MQIPSETQVQPVCEWIHSRKQSYTLHQMLDPQAARYLDRKRQIMESHWPREHLGFKAKERDERGEVAKGDARIAEEIWGIEDYLRQ